MVWIKVLFYAWSGSPENLVCEAVHPLCGARYSLFFPFSLSPPLQPPFLPSFLFPFFILSFPHFIPSYIVFLSIVIQIKDLLVRTDIHTCLYDFTHGSMLAPFLPYIPPHKGLPCTHLNSRRLHYLVRTHLNSRCLPPFLASETLDLTSFFPH